MKVYTPEGVQEFGFQNQQHVCISHWHKSHFEHPVPSGQNYAAPVSYDDWLASMGATREAVPAVIPVANPSVASANPSAAKLIKASSTITCIAQMDAIKKSGLSDSASSGIERDQVDLDLEDDGAVSSALAQVEAAGIKVDRMNPVDVKQKLSELSRKQKAQRESEEDSVIRDAVTLAARYTRAEEMHDAAVVKPMLQYLLFGLGDRFPQRDVLRWFDTLFNPERWFS